MKTTARLTLTAAFLPSCFSPGGAIGKSYSFDEKKAKTWKYTDTHPTE